MLPLPVLRCTLLGCNACGSGAAPSTSWLWQSQHLHISPQRTPICGGQAGVVAKAAQQRHDRMQTWRASRRSLNASSTAALLPLLSRACCIAQPHLEALAVLFEAVALLALAALAVGQLIGVLCELGGEGGRVALLDVAALGHDLLQRGRSSGSRAAAGSSSIVTQQRQPLLCAPGAASPHALLWGCAVASRQQRAGRAHTSALLSLLRQSVHAQPLQKAPLAKQSQ